VNDLAGLQRRFMASMTRPDDRVVADLRAEGGIDIGLGMRIYSNAYQARLREVLGKDHVALSGYLGNAPWDELCTVYIDAHPSRHRSLRQFGDALPDFLAQQPLFKANPEVAELACFERSLLDCFDAPAAPLATWMQLQDLPASVWPELRLRFAPSVRHLAMISNAVALWIALKDEQTPPRANLTASAWLCWRDVALVTQFRSLDDEEAALLAHFIAGGSFSDACELLLTWHPAADVPARAVAQLACWAGEGLVSEWCASPA